MVDSIGLPFEEPAVLSAAIDIGSNSILLLIANVTAEGIEPLREEFLTPRLGEGLTGSGSISAEAIGRAEADLRSMLAICGEYGIATGEVAAVATAAVREAANGDEFVEQIASTLGLRVDVIDGEREAELSYAGAVSGMRLLPDERIGLLDVGGASSEMVLGIGHCPVETISLQIGAVRLRDLYGRSPGLAGEAIDELRALMVEPAAMASGCRLVAVGGSATTLAAVRLGLESYDADAVSGFGLTRDILRELIELFRELEVEQIAGLPGMEPARADIIEAGATILAAFAEEAHAERIEVSPRGLRYGLLVSG